MSSNLLSKEGVLIAPADAARWEKEPVHEDASTVIVWVISQKSMPFVLLLTGAVPVASQGGGFRADLLVHSLFKLIVVDDGSHLTVAVTCPKWGGHLNLGLTNVRLSIVLRWIGGNFCLSSLSLGDGFII